MSDLFMPDGHLIVGLADDADGSLRVFLDARYLGLHTHVDDSEAQEQIRSAWDGAMTQHLTTRVPNVALCNCAETRSTWTPEVTR